MVLEGNECDIEVASEAGQQAIGANAGAVVERERRAARGEEQRGRPGARQREAPVGGDATGLLFVFREPLPETLVWLW